MTEGRIEEAVRAGDMPGDESVTLADSALDSVKEGV